MADIAKAEEAPPASAVPEPKDERPAVLIVGGLGKIHLKAAESRGSVRFIRCYTDWPLRSGRLHRTIPRPLPPPQ